MFFYTFTEVEIVPLETQLQGSCAPRRDQKLRSYVAMKEVFYVFNDT